MTAATPSSKIRNLQTEETITSGPCGHGAAGTGNIPTPNPTTLPLMMKRKRRRRKRTTTTTTNYPNPLVPPADPITTDPLPDDNDDDDDNPPQDQ